jgi:acetoin utilization protein AcuC
MLTTRDYEVIFRRILELADELTAGRVLFTLGGGYSFRATPRVWALLYLVIHGLPIPHDLPNDWRDKWNRVLEQKLPKVFHDPESGFANIPNRPEITHRNQQMTQRLLDAAASYWF